MSSEPALIELQPKRLWRLYPRLKLRTLLVLVFIVGLPLAWFGNWLQAARRQRTAVAELYKERVNFTYDYGLDANGQSRSSPAVPRSVLNVFGVDAFYDIGSIDLVSAKSFDDRIYSALAEVEINEVVATVDGDKVLTAIAKNPKRMKSVMFTDTGVTDAGTAHLGPLPKLKYLFFQREQITGEGLLHLSGSPELEYFIAGWSGFTDAGLRNLQHCSRLEVLVIGSPALTDAGLATLKHLSNLKDLVLYARRNNKDSTEGLLTDRGMQHLRELVQLEQISLCYYPLVGATSLQWLADFSRLKHLNLVGCGVTDATINSIGGLKNLEHLELVGCPITDAALGELSQLDQLEYLMLGNCTVTDQGISKALGLPRLTSLTISDCAVGEAIVPGILSSKVKHIVISPGMLSDGAVKQLQLSGVSVSIHRWPF